MFKMEVSFQDVCSEEIIWFSNTEVTVLFWKTLQVYETD